VYRTGGNMHTPYHNSGITTTPPAPAQPPTAETKTSRASSAGDEDKDTKIIPTPADTGDRPPLPELQDRQLPPNETLPPLLIPTVDEVKDC